MFILEIEKQKLILINFCLSFYLLEMINFPKSLGIFYFILFYFILFLCELIASTIINSKSLHLKK
jgi:hypothetical protein